MAFAALASGVSGLQAFSSAIGVISDNITNVNTVGYKESRTSFTTLVTETSSTSSYSPGGVQMNAQTLVSKAGVPQRTTSATDLFIDGAGFFTVKDSNSANENGEFLFTRSGAFIKDDEGFLQNQAGLYLMGWPTDSQGSLPDNLTDLNELVPINVSQLSGTAEPTANAKMRVNLQSSTPVNAAYTTVGQLATGAIDNDYEFNVHMVDSLGAKHTFRVAVAKTDENEWAYEMFAENPSEIDSTAHPDGLISNGTIAFNSDGTIDDDGSTFNPSKSPEIFYNGGAASAVVNLDFGTDGEGDGFTQYTSVSSLFSSTVDGAVFGNVTGVEIDKDGVVTAQFDNGLSRKVFQLPIATFPNPDGLSRRQGNAFGASDFSGSFALVQAGTAGAGRMQSSALEGSTVELANEFAELIKTQRSFSASTRIISTADEILQELTRL